jgi:hypothetical protein
VPTPPLGPSHPLADPTPQVPLVKLDDLHYKLVDRLERLVKSPPSLRDCASLTVKGPVRFGPGVVLRWVAAQGGGAAGDQAE